MKVDDYVFSIPDAIAASAIPLKSSFSIFECGVTSGSPSIRMIRPGLGNFHSPNNKQQSSSGSVLTSHRTY